MNILLVSATIGEIQPYLDYLEKHSQSKNFFDYEYNGHTITPLITGVGQFMMGFALPRYSKIKDIDIAINAGISGSLDRSIAIGEVVEVLEDRFADLGIEEADGNIKDVYEIGLVDNNLFPLVNGCIQYKARTQLKSVKGITVNRVSGTQDSINKLSDKYDYTVESMEGAAFLFACKSLDVDCIQVKAISNYIEKRDRSKWDIPLAVNNLTDWLVHFVDNLDNK